MDLNFVEEQKMLREMVAKLAKEKMAPKAAEMDAKAEFPWDNMKLVAGEGLLGLTIPESYGGGEKG